MLSGHAPSRDLMKLPPDERDQRAEGGLAAPTPFQKQYGGLRGVVRNVAILPLSTGAPIRGPFALYRLNGEMS
jgi:hypothetical protein